jgi:PAS domain S-box-containing protein
MGKQNPADDLPREDETRLRALVGSIDEVVFEFDAVGTYLNIWTRDEGLLVRPRREMIGRRAADIMGEEQARPYLAAFDRVLAGGHSETIEYPLQLGNARRWFLTRITPIAGADGVHRTVCVLARDITERKRSEQRLAAQYAVTRVLAEAETLAAAAPRLLAAIGESLEWKWGALWVVERQAGTLTCQSIWQVPDIAATEFEVASRSTAFAPGEGLPGMVWRSAAPTWVPDLAKDPYFARAAAAAPAGLRSAVLFPILLGREPLGVIEFFGRALRQPDQEQLTTLLAVGSQIGQFIRRKGVEEALQQSEKRFRALIEHSADGVFLADRSGAIIYASPSLARVLGDTSEEHVGRNAFDFVHPDQQEDARRQFDKALREPGQVISGERLVRHQSGAWRWVDTTTRNLLHEPGVRAVVVNLRDITERRQAEQALRESERRFREYAETASDWFWETGPEHSFTQSSRNTFGFPRIIGEHRWSLAADTESEPEKWRQHRATLDRHDPFRNFEYTSVDSQGRLRHVSISGRPVFDEAGRFTGYRGTGTDLTEQREAEERLRQAQKMEAVGQLTGGIAHDFNNLLTVITGTIEILADGVADRPALAAAARAIDETATRGAALTQQLLAFARRQALRPRATDINALIVNAARLLQPTLGEQIEIESMLCDALWPAMIDPSQLTTALINLAVNARDAMPSGGKLLFETANVVFDAAYARANPEAQPGNYAMIAVSDTGVGIPAALCDKVFEPFFTTKSSGKGTGLGLSMVYGFVKQSGGHIKIYSEEGHGTTVKLYLPRGRGEAVKPEPAVAGALSGGNETILVVEDDDLTRRFVVGQLESLGYTVLSAANGIDALTLVDRGAHFDVLFTDVIMPGGMNGRQLADAIARRRPGVRVLYTSGYAEDVIVHGGRLDPGVALLNKPYRKSDLARRIREVLSG